MSRASEWRNLAICGHASAGKTTLVDRSRSGTRRAERRKSNKYLRF
jgi:translation elongation factor EF-G